MWFGETCQKCYGFHVSPENKNTFVPLDIEFPFLAFFAHDTHRDGCGITKNHKVLKIDQRKSLYKIFGFGYLGVIE